MSMECGDLPCSLTYAVEYARIPFAVIPLSLWFLPDDIGWGSTMGSGDAKLG